MSKYSLQAKIEFMVEMIENMEAITQRHGGIVKALEDFEGQMALLMGLSQIGETLKKLDDVTIEKYELQKDRDGAYYYEKLYSPRLRRCRYGIDRKYHQRLSTRQFFAR